MCSATCSIGHDRKHKENGSISWWDTHIEPKKQFSAKLKLTDDEIYQELAKRFDWDRAFDLDYLMKFFCRRW
jgi:hypothetical protein